MAKLLVISKIGLLNYIWMWNNMGEYALTQQSFNTLTKTMLGNCCILGYEQSASI